MNILFVGNFHVDFTSETHHKKSLEALGHTVIALQEGNVSTDLIFEYGINSDLVVWVHTHGWQTNGNMSVTDLLDNLKNNGVPTITYHLDLWFGLHREQDLYTDPFYKHIGHFFTVDKLMADWFNEHTDVKGHYLRAGVFDDEAVMLPPNQPQQDVIFVGSKGYHPEWQWRPKLVNWLHETYGDRFTHIGPDGTGIVRGMALNQVYANAKVVVGDSLVLNYDYPYYWSDRVYETMGRGGFLIMPDIKGLKLEFDEDELPFFKFGDFDGLKRLIDSYVVNDDLREFQRKRQYEKVKNNYTYKHRWATILKELES